MLENQIISIYFLHLVNSYSDKTNPLIYIPVQEFGENGLTLYVGLNNACIEIPLALQSNSVLNITSVESNSIKLLDDQETEHLVNSKSMEKLAEHFQVLNNDSSLRNRISKTLETYQKHLPFYFDFLKLYTHSFVNICDEDMVSHSTEELPGFTFIHFSNRSDHELIDDLVHENGHHFLNTVMAGDELFEEDSEPIFFSPWRKTLRPIRGIYHAHCTFMWAAYLFHDMLKNEQFTKDLKPSELTHFQTRLFEELEMLAISKQELQKAFKKKAITTSGNNTIKLFEDELEKRQESLNSLKSQFSKDANFLSKIEAFKTDLNMKYSDCLKNLK